jgi:hypothetical protein
MGVAKFSDRVKPNVPDPATYWQKTYPFECGCPVLYEEELLRRPDQRARNFWRAFLEQAWWDVYHADELEPGELALLSSWLAGDHETSPGCSFREVCALFGLPAAKVRRLMRETPPPDLRESQYDPRTRENLPRNSKLGRPRGRAAA